MTRPRIDELYRANDQRRGGGPLGALLDRVARQITFHHDTGSDPTEPDPRQPVAFTIAAIALSAKMARADGAVSRDEVAAFHDVFEVPPGEEDHVRLVFDLARKSTHGFDSYARQVRRLFASDPVVLEHMLNGLFDIALADGRLCDAEDAYLCEVARLFGFDAAAYARIRAHHVDPEETAEENAYAILGVDPAASLSQIRIAYHRLVRETHPDLVVAKGLPPECVALANARIARINAAYDSVAKRGSRAAAHG
jgi:DnaJ like chaperone protein